MILRSPLAHIAFFSAACVRTASHLLSPFAAAGNQGLQGQVRSPRSRDMKSGSGKRRVAGALDRQCGGRLIRSAHQRSVFPTKLSSSNELCNTDTARPLSFVLCSESHQYLSTFNLQVSRTLQNHRRPIPPPHSTESDIPSDIQAFLSSGTRFLRHG